MTQATTVRALAILPSGEDQIQLRDIFCQSKWRLVLSGSLHDARRPLRRSGIGVVLTDCHLPDGGWRDVLHALEFGLTRVPPVIVVSRLADDRLWAEVLNLRGYDVLATPFHAGEVQRSISSAWRHWQNNVLCTHSPSASEGPQLRSTAAVAKRAAGGPAL
jgi:DNA-binding response OmpR family regulator